MGDGLTERYPDFCGLAESAQVARVITMNVAVSVCLLLCMSALTVSGQPPKPKLMTHPGISGHRPIMPEYDPFAFHGAHPFSMQEGATGRGKDCDAPAQPHMDWSRKCGRSVTKWYFDRKTDECVEYEDCTNGPSSKNRFSREKKCVLTCIPLDEAPQIPPEMLYSPEMIQPY